MCAWTGPSAEPQVFIGRTEGRIVQARGQTSFGWDPIFQPDGYEETYAQLDKAIKNTISHRWTKLVDTCDILTYLQTCRRAWIYCPGGCKYTGSHCWHGRNRSTTILLVIVEQRTFDAIPWCLQLRLYEICLSRLPDVFAKSCTVTDSLDGDIFKCGDACDSHDW